MLEVLMTDAQIMNLPKAEAAPSFSDTRVFIVLHAEAIPGRPLDYIGCGQGADGPTFIHVGIGLTDERLLEIWEQRERFPDIKLEQLRAVRNREVEVIQLR
jgi:hypothetical protein